jgi:hypothetical protein
VDIDAATLSLRNAAGTWVVVNNVNVTANIAAAGVNGLDTGVEAISTWYSIWVIYNGATISSLLSAATAAPTTLPAGYTYYRRVGWVRNNAAGNFDASHHGYDSDLILWDNSGANWIVNDNAYVAAWPGATSAAAFAPPTCRRIRFSCEFLRTNAAAPASNYVCLRPFGSAATVGVTVAFNRNAVAAVTAYSSEGFDLNVDSSQRFEYMASVAVAGNESGTIQISAIGYYDPI